MRRPPLGTALVAAALVAGTLAVGAHGPRTAHPARAQAVEVVGASAVCPDLRQAKDQLASRVSVGAGPLPEGRAAGPGTVQAVRVTGTGAPVPVPVTRPGEVAVGLGTDLNKEGLVVTARGSLAAGLEAEQVTRGEAGMDRGLAGLRCDPPRAEAWFEGGSTQVGDVTRMVMANVDDTPALVDVSVFSATGPVDPRAGQGITVAPHSRVVVDLDTLAPDRAALAVHVQARRGRIAAGLRHARASQGVPLGVDWVPQTVPPATTVVLPGVPKGPGLRELLITNPGTDDTVARVTVTTSDGQFVPNGFDQLDVPAGTTVVHRVDNLTDASPLAATVVSEGAPLLAGVRVEDKQSGKVREFSYTAGADPLSGPALVTDLVIDRPTESTLLLTAPQGAARVLVTPLHVLGSDSALPEPKTVEVPAGRTASLRLSTFFPPGASEKLAVEVRPLSGSGPVWAVRYLRARGARGPLTTLLVLRGPAQRVERPVVAQDPSAATG